MATVIRSVKIPGNNRFQRKVKDTNTSSRQITDAQCVEMTDTVKRLSAIVRKILNRRAYDEAYARGLTDAAISNAAAPASESERESAINAGLSVEELRATNQEIEEESNELNNTLSDQPKPDIDQFLKDYQESKPLDAGGLAAAIEGIPDDAKAELMQEIIALLKKAGVNIPDDFLQSTQAAQPVAQDSRIAKRYEQDAAARRVAANGVSVDALRRIIEG
ncbi:hypothetical protein [Paraburkholderia saeva]|uniref:hypothetical protein n=1 Tax=Paraburkholderia saeva TaxID=2777537 RepID=UPI001DCC2388|nr:hypothetical protein [Paraburkholderia saeva]CAG4916130.1 hypothetical protein R70241_04417 [Paraburkholderia saeva]